jgi:hypothetical protein
MELKLNKTIWDNLDYRGKRSLLIELNLITEDDFGLWLLNYEDLITQLNKRVIK